jgi:hypothetical protein
MKLVFHRRLVAVVLSAIIAALLLTPAAFGQPSIRERATEEISPGIRMRGGSVVIDLDGECDPPCARGQRCEEFCREGECDARSTAANPCLRCTWQCVE